MDADAADQVAEIAPERPAPALRCTIIGLNYTPEPTGIAPYTAGLAGGLASRGHKVKVITGYPHYPRWKIFDGFTGWMKRESIDGVDVVRLRHFVPARPSILPRTAMELIFGLRATFTSWDRPDVVISISPALLATNLVNVRARLTGTPVVTWVQDIYTIGASETGATSRLSPVLRTAERLAMRSSRRVVAIHDRFKRVLTDQLGASGSQVDVIRNWSHITAPSAGRDETVRRRHGWAPDDIVVLHAGNMGAKQGLENVVEASQLAAQRGSKVRFVLLGDGNQRATLESLGANPNLQFIDPLPDGLFEPTLASADILLVNERPGLTDMSVPSKLTSYFTTGRPVVAAVDRGSITAEEITASGCGPRVDPADPTALLDAVESLVADPDGAARAGRSAQKFCQARLSSEAAMSAFESTLGAALGSRKR